MKNLNLFNLKSIVRSKARWLLTLIVLLTLSVGQMWAANGTETNITVYYSISKTSVGTYNVRVNTNIGDGGTWRQNTMSFIGSYDGNTYIYQGNAVEKYGGVDNLQFQLYNSDTWVSQVEPITSWTTTGTYSGKMYNGSSWVTPYSYLDYYVAGDDDWLSANWDTKADIMTNNHNGTHTITISNVSASTAHNFKLTGGEWGLREVGYSSAVSCTNGTVEDNSGNIQFTTSHTGNVTITYNVSTGAIAILAPYQVSYAAGTGASGSVSASAITTYGSTCTLSSSTFSKPGYVQDGWATSDGGSKAYDLEATYTGGYTDVTLYPHWEPVWALYNNTTKLYDFTRESDTRYTLEITDATLTSNHTQIHFKKDGTTFYEIGADDPFSMSVNLVSGGGMLNWSHQTTQMTLILTNDGGTWKLTATRKSYAVTLNSNGGTKDGFASVGYGATSLSSISAPTYAGHYIEGYYKESAKTTLVADASGNLQANVTDYTDANGKWIKKSATTLYAKWGESAHTWSMWFWNSSTPGEEKIGDFSGSGPYTLCMQLTDANFNTLRFKDGSQYYIVGSGALTTQHDMVENPSGRFEWNTDARPAWYRVTITNSSGWKAQATRVYKVTYDGNGATGTAPTDANYYANAEVASIVSGHGTLEKAGYDFAGWTVNSDGTGTVYTSDGTNKTYTVGSADVTLYAKWSKHNYTITYSPASAATGCTYTTTPTNADYQSTVNITITPDEWHHVAVSAAKAGGGSVTVTRDGNNFSFTQPAANVTVTVTLTDLHSNIFLPNEHNSWNTADNTYEFKKVVNAANTATLSIDINKGNYSSNSYKFGGFNIYQSSWGTKWWKNSSSESTTMTSHNCTNWGFNTSEGDKNTSIDLPVSGTYTLTLTNTNSSANQKLSVTYPDKSFIEGAFATAWDEDAYPLIEDGTTQSVTIPITSPGDVQFRLVSHGKLYGTATKIEHNSNTQTLTGKTMSESGGTMTIAAYVAGDYTFTYNEDGKELEVTWPEVNQVRIYEATPVDATNTDYFDLSAAVDNVRSKQLSLEANTTYRFKIVYNSDYYGCDDGTLTRSTSTSSNTLTTSTSGDDMTLTTDYAGNYTFKFNQSDKTLSVDFPEAYAVTHGEYAGTASLGSYTVSPSITSGGYVAAGEDVTFTATPNLGYKTEWYDNSGCTGEPIGTGNTYTISSIGAAKTVYAKFELMDIKINSDIDGSWPTPWAQTIMTHSSGSPAIYTYSTTFLARATEDASAPYNSGYHFNFLDSNDELLYNYNGVQEPTSSGSSIDGVHKTADGNPTIQFGLTTKSDVTITLTLQSADDATKPTVNITAHPYYNVTFDAGSGTCATANKEVVYGKAYGDLPVATPPGADSFVGWFTESVGGEQVTAETIVNSDVAHTLFAHYESTYIVTIQFKCGSVVLYPQTTTSASATTIAAAIAAPEIIGYRFNNWTQSDSYVTFEDDDVAETTIHATGATTITANYTAVPTVYFKNNLGWENVYVSFNNTWKEVGGKQVPVNKNKPYYKMTQLGTSDIFYCEIPTSIVSSWQKNIAFDNTGFGIDEENHKGTWNEFYGGEFLGRGDFASEATMYIPYNGDTETRNSGTYYRTGCWMKYNSTDPGYKIYANTHVSGSEGEAVDGTPVLLTADVAGGFEFKAKVNFPTANYSYGFMLKKEATSNTNDLWYTNTGAIYSTTTSLPWHFYTDGASEDGQRCEIHTEAVGDYEFTVSFGTGRPVVNVEYPVGVDDWKLIYKDRAAWSGAVHTAAWQHPSRVIKAKANTEDIVSFFVSKATGANATIELYKCTAINSITGEETWTKQSDVNLSGITETGIYNFKVTQDADKDATVTFDGGYTGNFYIRTDASDGGWSNYKTSGKNTMTYSEYSATNHNFSHYFMRYANAGTNIKFCIANDYSECISDTLVSDTYTNEWLEANANIRFMWYHATNKISRAYLAGSSNVADRFLVLEGDNKLFDENGNALTTAGGGKISGLEDYEMKFTDDQNWVYEATVKAKPTAPIKLTAKFNDKVQYFYGTESTTYQLIGGTGDTQYKIRVVYDFKTNRLVAAWLPDGTSVSAPFPINADIMIIRSHQGDAQQITFSDNGKLTDVKTVYGAMRFNKYRLNNQSEAAGHSSLGLSQYERDLYFISFPFEVKLNEVFGFGTYGKHWIIEYYDGKGRAQNGFWADSPTNWKFVTPQMKDTFTLKANQGYVLALDLEELTMSSSVWNYGVDSVYLYFPSSATVGAIQATTANVTIDQTGYKCTINRPYGSDGDRRIKDSYWHLLGVPSFANANHSTATTMPTEPDGWTSSAPYVYTWNPTSNQFTPVSSASYTFKPMYSYLAQYAQTSITWTSVNTTPPSVAARTREVQNYEFQLTLQQDGEELDHTFVSLRDDEAVSANFDFNFDLSKMLYGAFSSKSNIYTLTGDAIEVAGNCLPLTEQTTIVPVGVTVGANGEYTFSLPDVSDDMSVTLIDNEFGTRTDLRLMDYDVNLTAGTYSDRFMLELRTARGAATDIEGIEGGNIKDGKAHKFVRDGILYILRDGVIYDAMGKRVK